MSEPNKKRLPFAEVNTSATPRDAFIANANFIHWPHKELGRPSGSRAPSRSLSKPPVNPRTGRPVKKRLPWT